MINNAIWANQKLENRIKQRNWKRGRLVWPATNGTFFDFRNARKAAYREEAARNRLVQVKENARGK